MEQQKNNKDQSKIKIKKEPVTEFNIKNKSTFPGFKEKKLENCTTIEDVKAYKEKYRDEK